MNRLEQARENQVSYGLTPQGKGLDHYIKGHGKFRLEPDVNFIGRIEKEVTTHLIKDVMESPVAKARLGGLIEKR